ncbi:MAG: type II toxin-antitoxin system VapC family toxin [Hahellaceae bacterium]|jgi:predicted nucleic-acid-binding protein|nr:type II toxin-antitoxin system VapC family toxin [Hahellaceae bacterium]
MIAIDTNVLLRYLLDDDKAQSKRASELILGGTPVLITDVVLVETVWTLKGKRYNLDKEALIKIIHSLFKEPNLVFESGQTVWRALNDFRNAKPVKSGGKRKEADFPDALIVNKARFMASETGTVFEGVYTFDRAAQQIPGTEKP